MKEEKILKHWLKRRFKITVALVVSFLITGGISFAGSIEDLEKRVAELEKNKFIIFLLTLMIVQLQITQIIIMMEPKEKIQL